MFLNFIEITNMCKFISILFILLLGNLLSVSSVYAQATNTTISLKNGCERIMYITLKRHKKHKGQPKQCGKQTRSWRSYLTLPGDTHTFGPRHVRKGCVYSLIWSKHKGDPGLGIDINLRVPVGYPLSWIIYGPNCGKYKYYYIK